MKIYTFVGDFYHPHDIVYPTVKKSVALMGDLVMDCRIDEMSSILDVKPKAIILASENRLNPNDKFVEKWLTPKLDEKITDYVSNGGSIVVIHSGIAEYPEDSKFVDMLKGYFVSHPDEHCMVKYTSNEKLPFNGGTPFDYEIMDEFYVCNVDTENTNVFITTQSEHGEGYGGWYHNYGRGKVIVLVPTHNLEGYEHPETLRLINKSVAWAIGRD